MYYENKIYTSYIIIVIAIVFTFIAQLNPDLYSFWINNFYIKRDQEFFFIIQIFTGMFLHGGLFHLFWNSLFIFIFWPRVEEILQKSGLYIFFFILSAVVIAWGLLYLAPYINTFWLSWFALALLSFYTLHLYFSWDSEYKSWIFAIFLNIAIWLMPMISLWWHALGALSGILFFFLYKKLMK